jgi:hypothetical protein
MTLLLAGLIDLPNLLRLGGALQLVVAAANVPVVRRLDYAGSLAGAAPIVRQIFWVHLAWIWLSLLAFAGLDLAFAHALAGASPLGRYASGMLAVLWTGRLAAQLAYYDRAVRRAHRSADVAFSLVFLFLALVHGVSAAAAPLAGGVPS